MGSLNEIGKPRRQTKVGSLNQSVNTDRCGKSGISESNRKQQEVSKSGMAQLIWKYRQIFLQAYNFTILETL